MNNNENQTPKNQGGHRKNRSFHAGDDPARKGGHYQNRFHGKHENKPFDTEEAACEEKSTAPEISEGTEYSVTVDLSDDATLIIDEAPENDDSPKVEVVGIRFKKAGKVYYFAPGSLKLRLGDSAVVETARGPELGDVACGNRMVREKDVVQPLRPVIRIATKEDIAHGEENKKKENEAFSIGLKKIEEHGLDMKLVDVEYTFDNSKLLFYFTSAGRVDFRELVKDLASVFRTRIELRQIGIRDEAKLMGGLGVCGRPLCCASFLSDFVQVSIKMAKEQNLSLNSTKISGSCGRLMCCLRYEHDTYETEIKLTPSVDSVVKTEDGIGTVIETSPLAGLVKVRLDGKNDVPPKFYHRDNVKVIKASRQPENNAEEELDSEE
jgi:cell fate regulator YaaT (PSP1 superfamily)